MTDDAVLIAGRYRLLARVGRGAMGVVWRARDELLDRVVAVKQLDATTGVGGRRGMREARVAARLRHPHAITVYDVVEQTGNLYLVMEFLPSSLAGLLAEHGTLPAGYVAKAGAQVASALATAQAAGIVHRDVTPGNVLITADGTAVIADFGISRASGEATVTSRGFIAGTPAYLAPEVAGGEEAGFPSDVFSLGATLYTALEGRPPFGTSENTLALLVRIAYEEVDPPRHGGPLADVLLSMLRRDAAERPAMAEVRTALAEVAHGRPVPPPRPVAVTRLIPRRRRLRRWRVAAVTAVAACLAGAAFAGTTAGGAETTGALQAAPAPSTTSVPSPAPVLRDRAECEARYEVTQSWQGGYQVLVTVRNLGRVSLTGWVVRWTEPAGHRISNLWNGVLQQRGASVAITNAAWNAVVAPDASTTFGFIGLTRGDNPATLTPTCQTG
ncbi:protein kinase domain-containing protein [Amycolatopsis sp. H20-H5]|uniref:protein kinase domain-containing protein n=1 Tax=Amycolatopsis sp. H20-H5 TaxID=3046309 RepID=UPI002DBDC345|nr:protein kinase [Amycolatopsis sp. H20-H5]MEC3980362.1 protein kinase [Amycolatopsis sp. H20-H5]